MGERKESEENATVEDALLRVLTYSKEQIRRNKQTTFWIICGGLLFLFFALIGGISWFRLFVLLISLGISSTGIYRGCRSRKLLFGLGFFLFSCCFIFVVDYQNLAHQRIPLLAFSKIKEADWITYETVFYNVSMCNPNTNDVYQEIDFSKKKSPCTNPKDAHLSDFSRLLKFQNPYLGNNSNTVNLYRNLPLASYGFQTEIDSAHLGVIITYEKSMAYVIEDQKSETLVKKNLVYNVLCSFLLVNNLEYLEYVFPDGHYQVTKKTVMEQYPNYEQLKVQGKIKENTVHNLVEQALDNPDFVKEMFDIFFQAQ